MILWDILKHYKIRIYNIITENKLPTCCCKVWQKKIKPKKKTRTKEIDSWEMVIGKSRT